MLLRPDTDTSRDITEASRSVACDSIELGLTATGELALPLSWWQLRWEDWATRYELA